MIKKTLFVLAIGLFTFKHSMAEMLPAALPVPGGIAIIDLKDDFNEQAKAYFGKKRVLTRKVNNAWQAMVGLPLKIKPGIHKIFTIDTRGNKKHYPFSVANKDYETRHLTITNKRMVSPTKKDIERHYKERPLILAALKKWTEHENVQTDFIVPVEGRFSSIFGLKRIYNKQKRIRRHTGLDIAAPVGTLIKSPARGTVIRTGSYFFTGNTVFIDHGQGLISMYSHLNKTHVKAGQPLEQGQAIGTIGMTGRVSGPHLHWVISLNNTKVDPKLFLPKDVFK
ncbi:MAG: peptidoglycan DD-metalloendopeptidase family protein [Gammaproteobacteria bacterium]|nr:peptidoglycan DD-metalloendopeptidase family protein [Gammaproteobacteria bacterium]